MPETLKLQATVPPAFELMTAHQFAAMLAWCFPTEQKPTPSQAFFAGPTWGGIG